jgi:hypothetical protein
MSEKPYKFETSHFNLNKGLNSFFESVLSEKNIPSSIFNPYYAQIAIGVIQAGINNKTHIDSSNLEQFNPILAKKIEAVQPEKLKLAILIGNNFGKKIIQEAHPSSHPSQISADSIKLCQSRE